MNEFPSNSVNLKYFNFINIWQYEVLCQEFKFSGMFGSVWSVFRDISDTCSALIIRTLHPEVDDTSLLQFRTTHPVTEVTHP
jgi:hypothetical protein